MTDDLPYLEAVSHPVSRALETLLRDCGGERAGEVADYIPELASVDPDLFGIAVTSVQGHTYAAGDAQVPFTLQSISKPFIYALAMEEHGLEELSQHVGFEPSGEPFNAISLEADSGRPANPLINAGAIVTSAMVSGPDPDARFERIRAKLSEFAGRRLELNEAVYRSESATGNRNRALAYLTLSAGVLPRSAEDAAEVYFRQCAVSVTTVDLAVMAATLANSGVNPVTGLSVISEEVATRTLSVMATCGMYDRSGEWMVRVGLPAKSGVSGGIIAIQPAEFGIGVFSPRLNEQGNSSRGTIALEHLSANFRLHVFSHPLEPRSPFIGIHTEGGVATVDLRGEIDFIAVEQIVHRVLELVKQPQAPTTVRLDFSGVTLVRPAAGLLLSQAVERMAEHGVSLEAIDPSHRVEGMAPPSGLPV